MGSEPQFSKYPDLQLAQHIFSLAVSPQTAQHASSKYLQDAIKEHKMAPLYRHLAHPQEGVLNQVGEGTASSVPGAATVVAAAAAAAAAGTLSESAVLDRTLSRQMSAPPRSPTRRQSLVSSNLVPAKKLLPSSAGLLPWDEAVYDELKADNEKELEDIQKEEDEAEEKAGETEVQAARSKRAEFYARIGDKVRWAMHGGFTPVAAFSLCLPTLSLPLFGYWSTSGVHTWRETSRRC